MYDQLRDVWNELTAPGAPFEVTEVEVRGLPLRAYAGAPPSLREFWLGSAVHADKDYLVYRDERWTYAEAHREVAAVAGWLHEQGVRPGDRVAIAMRNYPEWMLAYWATVASGAAVVGMNAWWTAPELVFGVEDSTPKVLICDSERLERFLPHASDAPPCTLVAVRVDGAAARRRRAVVAAARVRRLAARGRSRPRQRRLHLLHLRHHRPAQGRAAHPPRLRQQRLQPGLREPVPGRGAGAGEGPVAARSPDAPTQNSGALVTTPLFHVTANNCVAHSITLGGGKLVHMYKWDPARR